MSEHLRAAAARRRSEAEGRAVRALTAMSANGEHVSFAAVARKASVSTDFLYRHPTLRGRIADLRGATSGRGSPDSALVATTCGTSSAVRSLAAELKQARARHREEVTALQKALAAAHGENLQLRRRLRDGAR